MHTRINRFYLYLSFLVYCYCNCYSGATLTTTTILLVAEANISPDYSPSSYSYRYNNRRSSNNNQEEDKQEEIDLGTTLVAIKYSGGVIVGADTRTSVGGYVSNKFAYKINPIFDVEKEEEDDVDDVDVDVKKNSKLVASSSSSSSSSCVLCRSGSAADTQWLAQNAKQQFRIRKLERPGYRPTISEVAHYLRYLMRDAQKDDSSSSSSTLQASLICAGYNAIKGEGQIYGITPGGSLWEEDYFCVSGSGSIILLGYLDSLFADNNNNSNNNMNMNMKEISSQYTEKEAIELVTKLLKLSIARDGSSGGLIRLYVVDQYGLKERTAYPFSGDSSSDDSTSSSGDATTVVDLEGFAKPKQFTRSDFS
jgi:20S proteasome subunit beta 1